MNLDQDIHAPLDGGGLQLRCLGIFQRGHDQQDAIGAQRPALRHLIGVQHEILTQSGQGGGIARGLKITVVALEVLLVGQHRKAARPAGFIGAGQRRRVEVLPDQALGGRGLLDLADQAVTVGPRSLRQGGVETAWRVGLLGARLQLRE